MHTCTKDQHRWTLSGDVVVKGVYRVMISTGVGAYFPFGRKDSPRGAAGMEAIPLGLGSSFPRHAARQQHVSNLKYDAPFLQTLRKI